MICRADRPNGKEVKGIGFFYNEDSQEWYLILEHNQRITSCKCCDSCDCQKDAMRGFVRIDPKTIDIFIFDEWIPLIELETKYQLIKNI